MAVSEGCDMSETPSPQPVPNEATPVAPLPLPAPVAQLTSLSGLGNVGVLIAAVALMWSRVDAIEARFDDLDMRIDDMAAQVAELSTAMRVQMVQQVSAEAFVELERRVTVLESRQ